MSEPTACIGIDLGTSGARVMVVSSSGEVLAEGRSALSKHGSDHRDAALWWSAVCDALECALSAVKPHTIRGIAVDATSGTLLCLAADGSVLAPGSMYNEQCDDKEILELIGRVAPAQSAVHGPCSALARALVLQRDYAPQRIVHQADWIAGKLCGVFSSDDNNALKTGYDSVAGQWPDWILQTGLNRELLPHVNEPGVVYSSLSKEMASKFGLPESVRLIAGTTDGCASFLATGASNSGDGVTVLGSSLTIKQLSKLPIFDPTRGVYSHRILGMWLAGGASNTGGNVLLAHFSEEQIVELSRLIDPEKDTGLDYYPLTQAGERFPFADSALQPRLSPKPVDRSLFLHGMLEGIAEIEKQGYQCLAELGAPPLSTVRSVGGGAGSEVWTRLRARRLGVPMVAPASAEAAYGTALLAHYGLKGE